MKELVDLILEAGMLKRVGRSGWSVLGIDACESVADHSMRCAVIGYILARMEKTDPYIVLLMTLFGDLHEARITDLHKMAHRYLDVAQAEDAAFNDQLRGLPKGMREELAGTRREYRRQETKAAIVARDADILECLIQAREYYEQGYRQAKKFMVKAPGFLKTKSARSLWKAAQKADLNTWWTRLTTFTR